VFSAVKEEMLGGLGERPKAFEIMNRAQMVDYFRNNFWRKDERTSFIDGRSNRRGHCGYGSCLLGKRPGLGDGGSG